MQRSKIITMPKYSVIFILSIAILFYCGFSVFSKINIKQNNCLTCHNEIYEKDVLNFYQHSPFEKQECGTCHLKQKSVTHGRKKVIVLEEKVEPVTLFNSDYLEEHTIFLKRIIPEAVYDINVVLSDMSGNTSRKEFRGMIPAKVRDVKTNDKKPPVISGIKVGPIKRATFLEATITWDTDEPSTSCVNYGLSEQYRQNIPEDSTLVKHHQVNLYELETEKEYHFCAISRDMFGNEVVSEDFVFNTATVSQISEVEETDNAKVGDVELAIIKADVFLLNSELGLYLEATKPVDLAVEYVRVEDSTVSENPQIELDPAIIQECPELNTGKDLTIETCYHCHPPEVLGVSHPVGVAIKETTKVPDDLPTLEGGIITCVTCHDVHSASRPYLARKEITRDICISCHEGY